jgi:transcriptional regulator with PAS, ATPase and Fis domain
VRGTHWTEVEGPIVMEDEYMQQLYRLIERIAPGNISVIIRGETGVGKEVVARLVHQLSKRKTDLFMSVNCAALPQSLLESELFGYEKGAFTGATKTKPGLLEVTKNGTFLLDEISEMPMPLQAKLLRVLEERQAVRIGGLKPYKIHARFLSTSNRDLQEAVRKGTFRQDLLYRLDGITLTVPPLRERPMDVEPLARHFVQQIYKELERAARPVITEDAIEWLQAQPWPGNVRELRNTIERSALLSTDGRITSELLTSDSPDRMGASPPAAAQTNEATATGTEVAGEPDSKKQSFAEGTTDLFASEPTRLGLPRLPVPKPGNFKDEVKKLEYQRIKEALEQCGGNQTEAARLLGISRRTLINRLDEYGIARPRKRRAKAKKDK